MREIVAEPKLIAKCGLYCGACKAYLKERCPGCVENARAKWCSVRTCCLERGYGSCADCAEFPDPRQCAKFNSFMAKVFGAIFNSDRAACIVAIKTMGREGYAADMAGKKRQKIPRR
jgi:hypothetical protein